MGLPNWRTSTAGTRVKVALWLASEVGAGGTFTKAQLREAFPAVEQVDRRMRDLRAEGWVIATYREDRSLSADELRLVAIGGPVWERGYRSRTATALTDKERQAVFVADGYTCAYCGIAGGEEYPDDAVRTAKLTVARIAGDAGENPQLQTLCDRCHAAIRQNIADGGLLAAIQHLDQADRDQLRAWIKGGKRPRSTAEQLWARYRRLPATSRAEVEAFLNNQ